MLDHLKGKCYKLIGYPPGHTLAKEKNPLANVVSQASSGNNSGVITSLPNLTITLDQCQELLAMLAPQLQAQLSAYNQQSQDVIPSTSSMPDAFALSDNSACLNISTVEDRWIIDTGASKHMVCSLKHLTTVTATISASVTLLDGNIVNVTHTRTVKLSTTLILTNVLVVPCLSLI